MKAVFGFLVVVASSLALAADADIAPPPPEARDPEALGHVLAMVPVEELVDALGRDVVPNRDESLARQSAHRPLRSTCVAFQ